MRYREESVKLSKQGKGVGGKKMFQLNVALFVGAVQGRYKHYSRGSWFLKCSSEIRL